ncbi:hypothetical protein K227x_13810 [Rubripirellula lacrimiformis]|uniref:Uncharacterized protein n=1 Tax=Rubripirellula lacrimiformis TaxID=1930273 RepID=A0A517N798_9BACT|nr:hypothetical protein K227x_13810 [Rubripirellula lacrimiformis]
MEKKCRLRLYQAAPERVPGRRGRTLSFSHDPYQTSIVSQSEKRLQPSPGKIPRHIQDRRLLANRLIVNDNSIRISLDPLPAEATPTLLSQCQCVDALFDLAMNLFQTLFQFQIRSVQTSHFDASFFDLLS